MPKTKQEEYERKQSIRQAYLHSVRGKQLPPGCNSWNVALMPSLHMKDTRRWEITDDPPERVEMDIIRFNFHRDGVAAWVECEGYLVDQWFREEALCSPPGT